MEERTGAGAVTARRNPLVTGGPALLGVIVSYAVVLGGLAAWEAFQPRGTPLRYALAALQGLVMAAYTVWLFVSIRQVDEMEQRILYESIALAFAATSILLSTYRCLEHAGLPALPWGALGYPVMFVFWTAAYFLVRRRYR